MTIDGVLTERECAARLRVRPREARTVLERAGLRVIEVSPSRWRVDLEDFERWYRRGELATAGGGDPVARRYSQPDEREP